MTGRWKLFALVMIAGLPCAVLRTGTARGQVAVRNQGYVPFSDAPIHYLSDDLRDPVALLQKRLRAGEVHLQWEAKGGYLQSVLKELKIPISSQTLVFSKTSFQYKKISPQTPRALYFNDDVYVGFVKNGAVLEFVSFDPVKGAIFYLLKAGRQDQPEFERAELDCTQCHIGAGTRGVPGVLLRSVYVSPKGTQVEYARSYITGQESPLRERWGGWYVTGTSGAQQHMGNVTVQDSDHPEVLDTSAGSNVTSLSGRFDSSDYLSNQSDIVAHLVLGHQTQMHNLITQTSYKARIALYEQAGKGATWSQAASEAQKQFEKPAEDLLRYLLFTNEAQLNSPITGTSAFKNEFEQVGPFDRRGRALRDFDLRTRIFRYPCSYLIYSDDWDAIPEPAKTYIYHRLHQVLSGEDQNPDFSRLTPELRKSILEILLDTKPDLPAEWRQSRKQNLHAKAQLGRRLAVLSTN